MVLSACFEGVGRTSFRTSPEFGEAAEGFAALAGVLVSTFELATGGAGRAVGGAVLVESAGGFAVGDAAGGATSVLDRGASVRFDGVVTLLVFFAEVVAGPKAG